MLNSRAEAPVILLTALAAVGIVVVILGDGAALSFADLGNSAIIRSMGVILVLGGALGIWSQIKNSAMIEACGLSVSALGVAIYITGSAIGAGMQSLAPMVAFLGILLTLLNRIRAIIQIAQVQKKFDDSA